MQAVADVAQLSFEGMEVSASTFQLKGIKASPANQELALGDVLSGTWVGAVTAIHFDTTKDGALIRNHVIEVTKAAIER